MSNKQSRLLCILILSLAISQIILSMRILEKVNENKPYGMIIPETSLEMEENLKEISKKLTIDLGLKFKMNELGTVVETSSIKGDGIINVVVGSKEDGNIDFATIKMNNYKDDIELSRDAEEIVRYFSANSKDSDKTLKTIDDLYKKLTSDEYLSSEKYTESLKEGSFYKFKELKDENRNEDITEMVEVKMDNPHNPTSGVEISISFY